LPRSKKERNITNFENIEDGRMTEIQNESINVEHEKPTFNDTIESIVLDKNTVINEDNESENSNLLNIENPGTWPEKAKRKFKKDEYLENQRNVKKTFLKITLEY